MMAPCQRTIELQNRVYYFQSQTIAAAVKVPGGLAPLGAEWAKLNEPTGPFNKEGTCAFKEHQRQK